LGGVESSPGRSPAGGLALAFAAFAAFACSDASVKLLAGHPAPYEAVFFGALISAGALPFMRQRDEPFSGMFRPRNRMLWLVRAAMMVVCSIGSVTAFTHLSMAEAFSLIFLMPACVTVLSVLFLKEQVGWRRWSAVIVGFIGVLVVLRPGIRPLNIGHLAAVVTAVSAAVTVVMMRGQGRHETRLSLYGSGLVGSVVGAFPLMLAGFVWPTGREWALLVSYGLLMGAGNALVIAAAARIPATLVAPAQYSQMLWALLFGALVFHSPFDWPMGLGAAIIIGSGIFTVLRETVRRPKGWDENVSTLPP
jgi:drug/metabolite transporter (DMT)-like permease